MNLLQWNPYNQEYVIIIAIFHPPTCEFDIIGDYWYNKKDKPQLEFIKYILPQHFLIINLNVYLSIFDVKDSIIKAGDQDSKSDKEDIGFLKISSKSFSDECLQNSENCKIFLRIKLISVHVVYNFSCGVYPSRLSIISYKISIIKYACL